MRISSPSSSSRRRSRRKRTKRTKTCSSRCTSIVRPHFPICDSRRFDLHTDLSVLVWGCVAGEQSCSASRRARRSGRSAGPGTCVSWRIARRRKCVWSCGATRRSRSAPTTTVGQPYPALCLSPLLLCGSRPRGLGLKHLLTRSYSVVPDMKLSPNVGSDRSWVWNAAADVSEGEPEAVTLAIRFGNPESMLLAHPSFLLSTWNESNLFLHRCQLFQGRFPLGPKGERGSFRQGGRGRDP